MSEIQDQIKEATENQDWGLVAELAKQLASSEESPTPKKRGRKPVAAKTTKTSGKVNHIKWHAEHQFAPLAIPNRPNKFEPEKDTKPYRVPNNKKFGEFAGQLFENEEAYLRAAVYGTPAKHEPPPARKISVTCNTCGKKTKIFESELAVYDESGYKCEKCLISRKKNRIGDDD